jgi:predicted NAD/FAD-dependent oxidoreductase
MVYRPTVRYADEFKKYVDDLFHATNLDRNQIIRAALFYAAFSSSFQSIMNQYKKNDKPLPSAQWLEDHHWLWMEVNPSKQEKGKDVNVNRRGEGEHTKDSQSAVKESTQDQVNTKRDEQSLERREGKFPTERIVFRNQGGISIKIG